MQNLTRTDAKFEAAPGQFDADTSARTQSLYRSHHAAGAQPQALNRAILVTFFGSISVDLLIQALKECARQHEVLRAHIQEGGKHWLIDPHVRLPFEFVKGDPANVAATEARLIKTVDHSMNQVQNLHGGPLWQATLFQLEPKTYVLLLTCHAVVGDTDSLTALAQNMAENYQLLSKNAQATHSIFEQGLDNTPNTAARSIEYWLKQKNSGVLTSQLPDMSSARAQSLSASRVDLTIPEKSRQALAALAQRHQCELYDVLVCALAILVKRLNPDAPVALHCKTPLAPGQLRTDQITMAVPFDIDLNLTGSETLETVSQALSEGRAHPVFNASRLRNKISQQHCQPVAISFGMVSVPHEKTLSLGHATGQIMTVRAVRTAIPFGLTVLDDGHSLRLECEYQTESFDDQTIVNWIGAYRALVIALARESRLPSGVLEILDPRHEALIDKFAQGEALPCVARHELGELLGKLAQQRASEMAIESDSRRLSWADFESMSNQIARHIIDKGLNPGQAVVVQLNDAIQSTVAAIACLKAQVPFVNMPVNLTSRLQASVYKTVDAHLVVTSSAVSVPAGWQDKPTIQLDVDHEQVASQSSAALKSNSFNKHHTAWFEIKAGSEDKPLCVSVSWQAVSNLISHGAKTLNFDSNTRAICLSNLNSGADLAATLAALSVGTTVLLPSATATASGTSLQTFCSKMRATTMIAPPDIWHQLTNAKPVPASLQIIVHGTGLTDSLARELLAISGTIRRTIGGAETGFFNVSGLIDSADEHSIIGRPQFNTSVRILDERAQPCPIGAAGELLIGGPCISDRYVNNPLLSSQHFVLDHFAASTGAQLFRTGITCAWRADGSIRVVNEA